jgi:hypothetical protein
MAKGSSGRPAALDLSLNTWITRINARHRHARAIGHSSFDSVPDLKRKIHEFAKHYTQYPKLFMRTASAIANIPILSTGRLANGGAMPLDHRHLTARK